MNKARYDRMVLLQNIGIQTKPKSVKNGNKASVKVAASLETSKEFSVSNRTVLKQSGNVTFMTQPRLIEQVEPSIVEGENEAANLKETDVEVEEKEDKSQWDVSHWQPKADPQTSAKEQITAYGTME